MHSDDLVRCFHALAPTILAGIALVFVIRRLSAGVHLRPLLQIVFWIVLALAAGFAIERLLREYPGALVAGWFSTGLGTFAVWRWRRGEDARETWRRRVAQAREHERRAAPPPLPPPAMPGTTRGSLTSTRPNTRGRP